MSSGSTEPFGPGSFSGNPIVTRHLVIAGDELRQGWGWLLFVGIVLVLLGTLALIAPLFATLATVLFYGWVLLFGGVAHAIAAFGVWRWGGFFLHVLAALIDIVLGILFLRHPDAGAVAITLLLAAGFMVGGLFRLIAAFSMRFPNWGWTVLSGVITFAVGVLLWMKWPSDSLVVIGLFIGIQMLFYGWAAVMLALAARSLSKPTI